jgi:antitoxin YefM
LRERSTAARSAPVPLHQHPYLKGHRYWRAPSASEARKALFPHEAIETVSKHGNAVLVSAEDCAALREGSYLLRSPANARRLLRAYENALGHIYVS